MGMQDVSVKATSFEPVISPLDRCELTIQDAVRHDWKWRTEEGKTTLGIMVTLNVTDPSARCENSDAKPGQIKEYINLEVHPSQAEGKKATYISKAMSLMEALGFEPQFLDAEGNVSEGVVTRTGRKVAPKGGHTRYNPDFIEAFFQKAEDGQEEPKFGVWSGLKVYAKLGIEKSEQYGDKNKVLMFLRKEE